MESIIQRKIKTYIGFAIKSKNIVFGADSVIMSHKKTFLILITNSINRTASKRVITYAERYSIPLLTVEDQLMEECVNRDNCKCLAILDKNLANAVQNSLMNGGATNE